MTRFQGWRQPLAVFAAFAALLLAGCNTPPAYSVSEQPMARVGTVESIQTQTVQNVPNAVGAIGGALIGGGLGRRGAGDHRRGNEQSEEQVFHVEYLEGGGKMRAGSRRAESKGAAATSPSLAADP